MTREYETIEKLCKDLPGNKAFDIYQGFIRKYRAKHNEEYHQCVKADQMEDYFKKREETFYRYADRYFIKPLVDKNK